MTGDIATYDEAGNFTIVDRLKELIKVKGMQVRCLISAKWRVGGYRLSIYLGKYHFIIQSGQFFMSVCSWYVVKRDMTQNAGGGVKMLFFYGLKKILRWKNGFFP